MSVLHRAPTGAVYVAIKVLNSVLTGRNIVKAINATRAQSDIGILVLI